MSLQEPFDLIEKYAKAAGLMPATDNGLPDLRKHYGQKLAIYEGAASLLMVIPCDLDKMVSLDMYSKRGVSSLSEICVRKERDGKGYFDAYLLLVSQIAPHEDMRDDFLKFELESHVCRRYVIWPDKNTTDVEIKWQRALRVSALALPESSRERGMSGGPIFDDKALVGLLDYIKENKGNTAGQLDVANQSRRLRQ